MLKNVCCNCNCLTVFNLACEVLAVSFAVEDSEVKLLFGTSVTAFFKAHHFYLVLAFRRGNEEYVFLRLGGKSNRTVVVLGVSVNVESAFSVAAGKLTSLVVNLMSAGVDNVQVEVGF